MPLFYLAFNDIPERVVEYGRELNGSTIWGLDNPILGLYDIRVFLRIVKDSSFLEQAALSICFRC